jgi:putative acetyltransferase
MNITIRRGGPADAEALHELYSCPKVIWGTLQIPYPSLESRRKRLAEPVDGSYQLLACVDDKVVGHIGLHTSPNRPRRQHAGAIGMGVHDDWQGKGIGAALMQAAVDLADQWLNLSRLELQVYTDNEPAIRLYTKFNFVIEGTHVKFAYRGGEFVDAHFMARLRETA